MNILIIKASESFINMLLLFSVSSGGGWNACIASIQTFCTCRWNLGSIFPSSPCNPSKDSNLSSIGLHSHCRILNHVLALLCETFSKTSQFWSKRWPQSWIPGTRSVCIESSGLVIICPLSSSIINGIASQTVWILYQGKFKRHELINWNIGIIITMIHKFRLKI